jgi:hypothetical protein
MYEISQVRIFNEIHWRWMPPCSMHSARRGARLSAARWGVQPPAARRGGPPSAGVSAVLYIYIRKRIYFPLLLTGQIWAHTVPSGTVARYYTCTIL